MNILFLSELLFPHGGGAEFATFQYAKLLSKVGYNVIVITNRFREESEVSKNGNLTIYRLPLFSNVNSIKFSILRRLDILSSVFMRKLLKWTDLVYVPRFWFSAIPLAKSFRKPVITHLHDYIPICPLATMYDLSKNAICDRNEACSLRCIYLYENRRMTLLECVESMTLNFMSRYFLRRLVEQSDAIICVSKEQRRILIRHLPSIEKKIEVVYNPLPQISPMEIDGDDFGYFGGPSYLKGFPVLCKAISHLREYSQKPIRVYATKFDTLDEGCFESIRKLGFIPHKKLDQHEFDVFYKQILATIVPSVWAEPLPYVVSEAILRGRLVIASCIGGIPEQVKDCRGTFLFTSGDFEQLAGIIDRVRTLNKESLIDLTTQNRQSFSRIFSNEKTLQNFTRVLNEATGY